MTHHCCEITLILIHKTRHWSEVTLLLIKVDVSCFRNIMWWRKPNVLQIWKFPQPGLGHRHPKSVSPDWYDIATLRHCYEAQKLQAAAEIRLFPRIPHSNKRTQYSYVTKTQYKAQLKTKPQINSPVVTLLFRMSFSSEVSNVLLNLLPISSVTQRRSTTLCQSNALAAYNTTTTFTVPR